MSRTGIVRAQAEVVALSLVLALSSWVISAKQVAGLAPALDAAEQPISSATLAASNGAARNAAARKHFAALPMRFEPNRGQADAAVKFISRGPGYDLFLTSNEAVLVLEKSGRPLPAHADSDPWKAGSANEAWIDVVKMKLVGADPAPLVTPQSPLNSRSNYFLGNDPAGWRTDVPHYGKVRYSQVYPGVDVVYYGNQRNLEFDLEVAPGSDPGRIKLGFSGAKSLRLNDEGALVVETAHGEVHQGNPVIYQTSKGERRRIEGRYVMLGNDLVGFDLDPYDASAALVIDPVLSYATLLGGENVDYATAVTTDPAGNAYITGYTRGSGGFPLTPGAYATDPRNLSAFACKLNSTGTDLIYSTYIGGSTGSSYGAGIAADPSGNTFVTGYAGNDFPVTPGAPQTKGSGHDAFIVKLNSTGSALLYSVCLGGEADDYSYAIAVDGNGNAAITGSTRSTEFPTINAYRSAWPIGITGSSSFVAELDSAGTQWIYSTYLGGGAGKAIAVDSSGNAYVAGSAGSTYPTTPGAYRTEGAGAFVTKLDPAGVSLAYSTFLGHDGYDSADGIAVDAAGNAYITGSTYSPAFPVTAGVPQTSLAGYQNAFVVKLNSSGSNAAYATYLGGNGADAGNAIAVDQDGSAWVTGETSSTDFPVARPLQDRIGTPYGVFRTRNGAGNWEKAGSGSLPLNVRAVVVDPSDSRTAYAAAYPGIFKTNDGGDSWTPMNAGFTGKPVVTTLAINPADPAILFCSHGAGIHSGNEGTFRTLDGAGTWSKVSNTVATVLSIDPSNPSSIYMGFKGGIAKSTDNGDHWTTIRVGPAFPGPGSYPFPATADVIVLTVDPHAPGTLYVAGGGTRIYKTTDDGISWQTLGGTPGSLGIPDISSLVVDPINSSLIYIAGLYGVFKSADAGVTWTDPLIGNISFLVVDPSNPSVLYGWNGGVTAWGSDGLQFDADAFNEDCMYKTTDGGNTWTPVNTGLDVRVRKTSVAVSPSDGSTLYTGLFWASDAFVTRLNAQGTSILFSTYLGGPANERGKGICLDAAGNHAFVTGSTRSWDEFPATAGAFQANPAGSIDSFVVKLERMPILEGLTTDTGLPAAAGTRVLWTAAASDGIAPLEYRFYSYFGGTWTMVRDYSTANTYAWTPAQAGEYNFAVWVRNAGSDAAFDAYRFYGNFNITPGLSVSLSPTPSLPQVKGTPIAWTATAAGGIAPLQYRFYAYFDGAWTMVQDYSTANTCTWTPALAGEYNFAVWVRNAGSAAAYDAYLWYGSFHIAEALSVSLTPSPALPQVNGTPITWTASAAGGIAPLQYRFYAYSGGAWTMVQDYSTANTCTWTPAVAGEYNFAVWVRNAGSVAAYDAYRFYGSFNITEALSVSLTPSPALPQVSGTPITWTATASGGSAPWQYRFYAYVGGAWTMIQDYSTANTCTWTPAVAGEYNFAVWVRNAGSSAAYDAYRFYGSFHIKEKLSVALNPSPALPQIQGTPITWTATAEGGTAPLQYRFYAYFGGAWTMVRDYSTANTCTWTPVQAGEYNFAVWVRNSGSAAAHDAYQFYGYFSITLPH